MSYAPIPNTVLSPHSPSDNVRYYTNDPMSARSKEEIELQPVRLLPADSSNRLSDELPDHTGVAQPVRVHDHRQNTYHRRASRVIRNIWLTAFLPAVAFAYLAFCYAAATNAIPVRVYKIDEPANHLCKCLHPSHHRLRINRSLQRWHQGGGYND